MEVYLTSGDAARILGLSQSGLDSLVAKGDVPGVARTQGGMRLFNPIDVTRVASQREERRSGTRWFELHGTHASE